MQVFRRDTIRIKNTHQTGTLIISALGIELMIQCKARRGGRGIWPGMEDLPGPSQGY